MACIVFIGIIWISAKITVTSVIIPILCNMIPDTDLKFESHRNILFHSIILPLIVFIYNPTTLAVLIIFSFGLHCLCDIRFKKVGGYYTIKWYKNKSISGYWYATFWFTINFMASLSLLIWWLYFFQF